MMWRIKMTLLTETLFGNGGSIPGYIDVDVQTDDYGIPFLKAKTLKGLIRENAELVARNMKIDMKKVENLFGTENKEGALRFGDAVLDKRVQEALLCFYKNGTSENVHRYNDFTIGKEEIKRAITTEYSYTRIENGVAMDHSLRTVRMLNKDLIFYADIGCLGTVTEQEKYLIGCAVGLLKHVGTLKSKGKGSVKTEFLEGNEIITERCFENLDVEGDSLHAVY